MKTRFVQQHKIKEKIYHPGESADHLSAKEREALLKKGVIAEMAADKKKEKVKDEQ